MNYTKWSLLLAFTLFCAHSGYAQLEKGNLGFGGTIGLANQKTDYINQTPTSVFSFSFNPTVSYFLFRQFSVGLLLPLSYAKISGGGNNWNDVRYSVGPVVRYYFPFEKWAVFPELSYSLGRDIYRGPGAVIANLSSFKTGIGITYFLDRSIGIEGILVCQESKRRYENDAQGDVNTSTVSFNIGLQIYLNRKMK